MTQWSPQQDAALKAVDDWYKNHRHDKQTFRLFGCAGTGKTTLAKHFAANIEGLVKFACFTGKAAHVMAQKGCVGTSTVHKLIYIPKTASKNKLRLIEKEVSDLENIPKPWSEIHLAQLKKAKDTLQQEQQNTSSMSFSLNLDSELKQAKLLILDECSMISENMGKDLESFGVPILVLGDPEQLPPIFGQGYFTEREPDTMLDEIHRQALDNPIIKMSTIVREGGVLPLGKYGESMVTNEKLSEDDILEHDIILTGLRKTKRACDDRVRQVKQLLNRLPMTGDSIMCIKNNHTMGLLNGQIWEVLTDAVSLGGGCVSIHIKDPDNGTEMAVVASEKLFYGTPLSKWEHEQDIEEFEYAYAITVHKSQGSQWDNVLLFDQKDRFNSWNERDRRRWLYTGITRAAERITVMRL